MTSAKAQRIVKMLKSGEHCRPIAATVGVSVGYVYMVRSRARAEGETFPVLARATGQSSERGVHLSRRFQTELTSAARRRGLQAHQLATRILALAIDEQLIDGILDDADEMRAQTVTETPKGTRHAK